MSNWGPELIDETPREVTPNSTSRLDEALHNLGFAVKSLQLYPPTSPIVESAVGRSYESLQPLLDQGYLTIEVTPRFLRVGEAQIGVGNVIVEHLARRLHERGVARVHFDVRLPQSSLQRLAELVAMDRRVLDERGGLDVVLNEDRPQGVHAEFLELDRLFDEDSEDEVEDIWEALLQGFSEAADIEDVDWNSLANNVERLQDFVAWMADNLDDLAERTGYDDIDILRFVAERIGSIAAALGSEHVNFLVMAVRRIFDRLDPELLIELLAEPYPIEVAEPVVEKQPSSMSLTDFLSGADGQSLDDVDPGGDAGKTIDITQVIACGLEPSQAESLILHTMQTRERSSTRLYGLFSRLMEGREDRSLVVRRVRAFLEQELTESADGDSFLDNWPRLSEVLEGDAPERFISSTYDMMLQQLLADDSLKGAWPVASIRPRIAEMRPGFIVRRKVLVLAQVLEVEEDDTRYAEVADELEDALHELVAHGQYQEALQLLRSIHNTVANPASSEARRQVAAGIVERFYRPDVLRQLLREALGAGEEGAGTITEILELRGPAVIPVLLDTLAEEDTRRVRQRLLRILADLGEPVTAAVAERLDDERWYVVRNLLLLLGESEDPDQMKKIVPLLDNEDSRVRRHAVEAIIKLGAPGAADALVTATGDEDEEVRVTAIHGLGFHRSTAGIERLREIIRLPNLKGQNSALIRTAVIALTRLGDADSRARIQALAGRPWLYPARRREVQAAAAWAVEAAAGKKAGAPPEPAFLGSLRPGRSRHRLQVR